MFTELKSKLWWLMLAVVVASAALFVAGCSNDDSPVDPAAASPTDLGLASEKVGPPVNPGPPVKEGLIAIRPNIETASWTLKGTKKYQNVTETGTGTAILTLPAGTWTITWGTVEGYEAPVPAFEEGILLNKGDLLFAAEYFPVGFVLIPPTSVSMPATFTMGSTVGGDEILHQVTLTGRFCMASTEVTNSQYASVLQWAYDQGYVTVTSASVLDNLDGSTQELLDLDYFYCQISFSGGVFSTTYPDHPVFEVSWHGSAAYCDWLSLQEGLPRAYDHSSWSCNNGNPYTASGYRLPTEAEWEFACRAGTTTTFNTGDCLDAGTEANYDGSSPYPGCPTGEDLEHTTEVGSYPTNQWGLFDMHGNVWEWCNDFYGYFSGDDETDPVGVDLPFTSKVIRGGSFVYSATYSRSANRSDNQPTDSYDDIGFRPVRSIP